MGDVVNVCHEHRCVYLAMPRTGTRCAFAALRRYGFNGDPGRKDWVHTHQIGIPPGCEGYAVLATVRNPYTRMLSCWRWVRSTARGWPMVMGGVAVDGFGPFVRAAGTIGHFRSQAAQLGDIEPDVLLRFETLQEDFNDLPFVDAPMDIGFRGGGPVDGLYTRELAELVLAHWGDDFNRFSYPREVPGG